MFFNVHILSLASKPSLELDLISRGCLFHPPFIYKLKRHIPIIFMFKVNVFWLERFLHVFLILENSLRFLSKKKCFVCKCGMRVISPFLFAAFYPGRWRMRSRRRGTGAPPCPQLPGTRGTSISIRVFNIIAVRKN